MLWNTARTAQAWLLTLGYLSDEQISKAVAYTQEEGEPNALVEMDKDDFDEMMEEMELGDDEERFRAAVQAIDPSPRTRLLAMVEGNPGPVSRNS